MSYWGTTHMSASSLPHKDRVVSLKFTADQVRDIDTRAKRCGVSRSVWIRTILLQAATRQPSEGFVRVKEPDGRLT